MDAVIRNAHRSLQSTERTQRGWGPSGKVGNHLFFGGDVWQKSLNVWNLYVYMSDC